MEAIGTFRLVLRTGFILDLKRTFYISCFSRNLISISKLVPFWYSFNFFGTIFNLFKNSIIVGKSKMDDGLFKIHLNQNVPFSLMASHNNSSIKCCVMNEKSSMLWH